MAALEEPAVRGRGQCRSPQGLDLHQSPRSLPEKVSSRFMFCPAAITSASAFTRQSVLRRNLLIPCHSLASPNIGSTHTLRLRKAFS